MSSRIATGPLIARFALVGGLVLFWQLAAGGLIPGVGWLNPALFGRPSGILVALVHLIARGEVWPHLLATGTEYGAGLAVGLIGGFGLGLILSVRAALDRSFTPLIIGVGALPQLALAPFLVTWFGVGILSKVAVSGLMALFPIFFAVYQGSKRVERDRIDLFRVMGASAFKLFRIVIWPSLLPWLISGLRASSGLALSGAVIGEFVGATKGLGYLLVFSQGFLQTDRALAILVLLAAWGITIDGALRWVGRACFPWAVEAEGTDGIAPAL